MPLLSRGPKTLWIYTGVFLFFGVLVIVMTPQAVPLALCLPSIYCVFSERSAGVNPLLVGLIPAVLIFIPPYFHSVVLYLSLIGCGILLGRYVQRHNIGLAVLVPTGLIFFLFMLSIFVVASSEGGSLSAVISRWVGNIMNQVAAVYETMLSPSEMMQFKMSRAAIEARIIKIFPAIMATTFAFVMWLNLIILSGIRKDVVLRAWKCPDWVVGGFILAGVFTIIPLNTVNAIGLNLLIVISYAYFYQGLAIIASFMAERNWAKMFRWVIYILILSQIYIMIIIAALGLFDTWFDFRKRIRISKGDEK
jgi:hypothetical protein